MKVKWKYLVFVCEFQIINKYSSGSKYDHFYIPNAGAEMHKYGLTNNLDISM